MEVLLIPAVVVGVAVGVGFTTWQLSRQDRSRYAWVVDGAGDLSELEKCLNHFSEEGFGIHRILSSQLELAIRHSWLSVGDRSMQRWNQPGPDVWMGAGCKHLSLGCRRHVRDLLNVSEPGT